MADFVIKWRLDDCFNQQGEIYLMPIKTKSIQYEIFIILTVKIILLFLLWFTCFSHPFNKQHMPNQIATHLLHSHSEHTV